MQGKKQKRTKAKKQAKTEKPKLEAQETVEPVDKVQENKVV
jgi:hypothetical protein